MWNDSGPPDTRPSYPLQWWWGKFIQLFRPQQKRMCKHLQECVHGCVKVCCHATNSISKTLQLKRNTWTKLVKLLGRSWLCKRMNDVHKVFQKPTHSDRFSRIKSFLGLGWQSQWVTVSQMLWSYLSFSSLQKFPSLIASQMSTGNERELNLKSTLWSLSLSDLALSLYTYCCYRALVRVPFMYLLMQRL